MNKLIPILLGLLLLCTAVWLQKTSLEQVRRVNARLENLAYDLQLRTRLFTVNKNKSFNTDVVIVDIDDKSLVKEGRWPWHRSTMATLVTQLQLQGAAVIAFDVMFSEKEENIADLVFQEISTSKSMNLDIAQAIKKITPFFDNDEKFASTLAGSDTVLAMTFTPQSFISGLLPPPILKLTTPALKKLSFYEFPGVIANIPILASAAKNEAFINALPDDDGVIRRAPILIRMNDDLYPSLALEAVRLFLLSKVSIVTAVYDSERRLEGVKVADTVIPVDANAEVIVPFRGKSFSFPYYSATDVIHNKIPKSALSGKLVFIGTSATGLGDLKATAIQNIFPGVEVQATVADGILTHNFSYKPDWSLGAEILLTIFLGGILVFVFPYLGPRSIGILLILIPVLLIFFNNLLWEKTGLVIGVFIPLALTVSLAILNMVYGYLFETRRRKRLKDMFGQYVPEKHIDTMLASGSGEYGLFGEDREMTVLFADIRNFTSISEHMAAAQLKELLNQFFTPMTEIIFQHRGTIDKYVGDLIMAFWGAPLKDKRHAQHALHAAIDMQNGVEQLKSIFSAKGWDEVNIGIGLNTGIMSVGDMGSKFRRNYTVLGDAVNLASRVESLTKYYGVKIIVTENTEKNQGAFLFRKLDRVRVKGKETSIEIFEVLCVHSKASEELLKEIEVWHEALTLYFNQEWQKAHALFESLAKAHPETKIYTIYIERVVEMEKNPPPSGWDGVYIHKAK